MSISNQMLFTVAYTVLANGWTEKKFIRATDDKVALELFCEWWERDGSSIEELSSFYIVNCMSYSA
jgi:hypothetical protein